MPAFTWLKVSMASAYELQNISDLSWEERQEGKDWGGSGVEQRVGLVCVPSFCVSEAEKSAELRKTQVILTL